MKYPIQGVVFSLLETCLQGSSEAVTHISDLLFNQLNVARIFTVNSLYGIWLPLATRRFHSVHRLCSQQDLYLLSLRGFLDLCRCLTAFIFKADLMAEAIRCCIYIEEGWASSNVHHETVCIIQSVIFFARLRILEARKWITDIVAYKQVREITEHVTQALIKKAPVCSSDKWKVKSAVSRNRLIDSIIFSWALIFDFSTDV
jgi:hypothetical protein